MFCKPSHSCSGGPLPQVRPAPLLQARPSDQFVSLCSLPSALEPLNPQQADLGSHRKSHWLPPPREAHRRCPPGPPQPSGGPPASVDGGPDLAWPGASLGLAFLKTQEHLLTFPQHPRAARGLGAQKHPDRPQRGERAQNPRPGYSGLAAP